MLDFKGWFKAIGISALIVIPICGAAFILAKYYPPPAHIDFIHGEKPKDKEPFFCLFFKDENELKCIPYEDFLDMMKERNKGNDVKL